MSDVLSAQHEGAKIERLSDRFTGYTGSRAGCQAQAYLIKATQTI